MFTFISLIVELLEQRYSVFIFSLITLLCESPDEYVCGKTRTTRKACTIHTHSEVPLYEAEDDVSADEHASSAYACATVHYDGPVQVNCTRISDKVH